MNHSLTRRELLQRGAAGMTILSLPGLLAACGGGGGGGEGELKDVLRFSNWQYYMDFDKKTKKWPTLEDFTKETGIRVEYVEDINDNSSYFGKIQGPLSQGRGIDRDIIVMTDNSRFPGLLVEKEWVQKLDKERIPNFANLIEAQQSPPFDPERDYSLPWASGITGIATNLKSSRGELVTSIDQLLGDPNLKGKITLLTEMADTLGLVMRANGDDPTKVTDEGFNKAYDRIKTAVDSGQVRRFTGNDYTTDLEKGNIAAAVSWSGDVATGLAGNKDLRWNLAESGGMIWTDNMFVPLGGSVATASTYMNYVFDPKVAARIALGIGFISAVKRVREEAAKLDPDIAANPLIFPDETLLSKVVQFDSVALNNETYTKKWQALLGA